MLRANRVGLVLSGGGAKGAYQIGCWRALREAGIPRFSVISGTSVGALNAALIAMGDYDVAAKLWEDISPDQVLFNPGGTPRRLIFSAAAVLLAAIILPLRFSWRTSLRSSAVFLSRFRYLASNRPLYRLIREYVSLNKLRLSGTKVLCTEAVYSKYYDPYVPYYSYDLDNPANPHESLGMAPYDLKIDTKIMHCPRYAWLPYITDLTSLSNDREIVATLLRSASLPLIFRRRRVRGSYSLDGGIADNIPIYPVVKEGCDLVIVILLDHRYVPTTLNETALAREYILRDVLGPLSKEEAYKLYQQFCTTDFPEQPKPPFPLPKCLFIIPSRPLGSGMDFTGGVRARELIELGAKDTAAALARFLRARLRKAVCLFSVWTREAGDVDEG
ncbi:MAG TPA: patatin-like phospholipase family protein [Azospirillum sp.]|nr:patatin-like phospholipase family protein [Azospirillum sp.]